MTPHAFPPLNSVRFIDENTGYAVGDWGTILKTTDGGIWWTVEDPYSQNHLYSVSFPNRRKAFVAGAGGNILGTTNLVTGIHEKDISGHLQIYPVPSNSKITIKFPTVISTGVITINSLTGEELIQQNITSPKAELNISMLPQGFYIVKLVSGDKVFTGKIIRE